MRFFITFKITLLLAMFAAPIDAYALSDADSKKMFTRLVHSFYENDVDTFWEISSQFEKQMFEKPENVGEWMKNRVATQETYIKVKGVLVFGQARIASEKIDHIDFRFDGPMNAPSRIIVVTAWVNRVIEFDESVPPERRKIDQIAILKIYVTLADENLITFKSDEINFGYTFAKNE
ncbi:hypothetical protein MNBD_NITROSPINAE04-50 [hydrothermal vent metagenome]|uniref:Uncharacterized protein n=1 Tax=hydrothermal vent metagenome TaxID=652676 RepID=A0A3B1CP37_9ZZZZ